MKGQKEYVICPHKKKTEEVAKDGRRKSWQLGEDKQSGWIRNAEVFTVVSRPTDY